jgi:hypothetical protein
MEYAKKIQLVRDTINELLETYEINVQRMDENDNITQDILHQMELGSYNEGRKWYGQLRKTRKDRRENKNTLEILCKFKALMEDKNSIQFMRQLDEALGDARKAEKSISTRYYCAKYIKDLPISKDKVD